MNTLAIVCIILLVAMLILLALGGVFMVLTFAQVLGLAAVMAALALATLIITII